MPFLKFRLVDFLFYFIVATGDICCGFRVFGGGLGGAKIILEAGGMVQQLRSHTNLLEDPSLSPGHHVA